jgi:hypothetical protein
MRIACACCKVFARAFAGGIAVDNSKEDGTLMQETHRVDGAGTNKFTKENQETMKTRILLGCVSLLALIAAGCSSIQTYYDFDPSAAFTGLHTYAFADKEIPVREQNVANPIMDERIKMALSNALNAKGFAQTSNGQPDFTVAFVPASRRVTTTEYISGWNYSTAFPVTFIEGSLVVNIISTKTGKMIWRGSATDALPTNINPEGIQKTLDAAAKRLFKNFPPSAK